MFDSIIGELVDEAFSKGGNKVDYHDYYKYRMSYITEKDLNLIFLFVTGLTDNFDSIKKELIKCKKEFLNLFEDILLHKYDSKTFEVFDPTIDSIHRNLRPKISLVGFSGVGKTTITRLIKAEEIPMQHVPTITGDIATIKIGKLYFHLWDFAGQEQFSYLWNNFIKGSDAVLLITDSSLENIEKSKFFLELIKEQAGHAHVAVIGNKQDLKESMKPEQIEKILGLKTYSMIANEVKNRDKMIQIIADILEMSAEISPLLKPLLERDTLIEEATKSLENAEFQNAATLFEKISYLCLELGDDSLGREFYEKAQKIKGLLQKTSQPTPTPAKETPTKTPDKEPTTTPEKEPTIPTPAKETPTTTPDKESTTPPEKVPTIPPEKEPLEAPPKSEPLPKFAKIEQAMEEDDKIKDVPKKPTLAPPPPPPPSVMKTQKTPQAKALPVPKEEKPTPIKKPTLPPGPPPSKVKAPPSIHEMKREEEELIIQPKIDLSGLNLNADDFMIKQRPKTITVVPKDAKNKLKTSPFGQVSNPSTNFIPKPVTPIKLVKPKVKPALPLKSPPEPSSQESTPNTSPTPVDPIQLITPKSKVIAPPELTPPEQEKTAEIKEPSDMPLEEAKVTTQQKSDIEKALLDLKIKKSNISKMALDFDMKELTGEITAEELEEKKKKLDLIKQNLESQIKDLEDMLK
ncbi:MAG: GTP-binding protein [Candidatus Lokiarchaeota archaeon]|nr:GTP-binding protein [Candidatus Lokiarchaeota archaeon]